MRCCLVAMLGSAFTILLPTCIMAMCCFHICASCISSLLHHHLASFGVLLLAWRHFASLLASLGILLEGHPPSMRRPWHAMLLAWPFSSLHGTLHAPFMQPSWYPSCCLHAVHPASPSPSHVASLFTSFVHSMNRS